MSAHDPELFLHEEVMLLALRDRKGTVYGSTHYSTALGAAVVAELLLAGRIAVDAGRRPLVNVLRTEPMGDEVLDECLERMAGARRRARLGTWVQRCAGLRRLRHRVAGGLCDRGILRAADDTVLLVFHRTVYPELDPAPERRLIERLRRAIFGESATVAARTAVLIALAYRTELLSIPFTRKELRQRKSRLMQIADGELLGRATKEIVEAAQAAVVAACIVPAVVATSS